MDKVAFEQWKSEQYASQAEHFDYLCEHRLKQIHENLSNEYPPYPPSHMVSLARVVHVLSMRALRNDHPGKNPSLISYTSVGRYGLHRYWRTVFTYNDAINKAAQSGDLVLRDRSTGLPLDRWELPSTEQFVAWEREAIYPSDKNSGVRRAVEIMDTFKWPLLAPHFNSELVVSLAAIDAWAAATDIAAVGDVRELLQTIEVEASKRRQVTAAAIEAEKRGGKFDVSQWMQSNQKAELDAQETVKLPARANGKLAVEAANLLAEQLGRRASAKEVMNKLIEWAKSGEKSDILKGVTLDGRGVVWITDKGGERKYDIAALEKMLGAIYKVTAKDKGQDGS